MRQLPDTICKQYWLYVSMINQELTCTKSDPSTRASKIKDDGTADITFYEKETIWEDSGRSKTVNAPVVDWIKNRGQLIVDTLLDTVAEWEGEGKND